MGFPPPVTYRIDRADRLVVTDGLKDFAHFHGREIWTFFTGDEVLDINRRLVAKAREGRAVRYRYRCDTPTEQRLFSFVISGRESGEVDFESHLISAQPISAQAWLEHGPTAELLVTMCSWCSRVKDEGGRWHELGAALETDARLDPREKAKLTHGICTDCYRILLQQIGLPGPDKNKPAA